jgi:hypothetical protein
MCIVLSFFLAPYLLSGEKKAYRCVFPPLPFQPMGLVPPPYKRVAVDGTSLGKSGIPVYQPTIQTNPYHQATLMQLQQQPYIPVTCEYMDAFIFMILFTLYFDQLNLLSFFVLTIEMRSLSDNWHY